MRHSQNTVNGKSAMIAEYLDSHFPMFRVCSFSGCKFGRCYVSLYFRVSAFGKPKGPWRSTEKRAQADAIEHGLGGYDEWGVFFLSNEIRRTGAAHPASSRKIPARESSQAQRQV
jgi:hypothetical protein